MFSKLFPERLSSTWRLAILQGLLLISSVALCVLMAGWALRGDLTSIAKAVVLDDLGEYSVLYNRDGLRGLTEVFAAGKHEESQAVRIVASDGSVLFEQIPEAVRGYDWPSRAPLDLRPGGTMLTTLAHPTHPQHLLAGCQLLEDGNTLWFGRTDSEDRAYEDHIRANLWLAGLASAALMLLPLWWFADQVLRPVREMMVTAQTMSEGRADTPIVAPHAVPELRAFADAYNRGLARIKALTDELQDANDNLAHELRTPLARIRGNLEAYHDTTDNPAAKKAAARGLDEIDRATQLVHTILTIRAGEHQALKLHVEPVDLRALLIHLHDLYQPAAEQRGLSLGLEVGEAIVLPLDQQRITQAVANLLDNALAYTPTGGSVSLALQASATSARIIVRDTGPGVHAAEKERIWLRHARGSAVSARTPGMGLGLSLVHAIAIAHGGSTGCATRDARGAEFWIELPLRKMTKGKTD
jgi:signal transduction histidine kinase